MAENNSGALVISALIIGSSIIAGSYLVRISVDRTSEEVGALQVAMLQAPILAERTNEELGVPDTDPTAVTAVDFTVDSISFAPAEDDRTSLAVVQAHFAEGGPLVTVSLYHDSGSVPRYSFMFLAGSVILFAIHLPLLDAAERKRREFLTGGAAPAWYGPA